MELTKPLFEILSAEFSIYWTQLKKCNEIANSEEANRKAEGHCIGIGSNKGYLKEELRRANPEYVIGFGKRVYQHLNAIYEMETLCGTFSEEIASGETISGVRFLEVPEDGFKFIPTSHPSRGVPGMTTEQLKLDIPESMSKSAHYYEVLAEDVVSQLK
jgi:hypothetical protein